MELDRTGKELSTWGWYKKQAPDISKYIKEDADSYDDTNTPMEDEIHAGLNNPDGSVLVSFISMDQQHPVLSLYWEDEYFGELHFNTPIQVNTYPGHMWNLKSADKTTILKSWKVRDLTSEELKTPHIQPQVEFKFDGTVPDEIDDSDYDEL